MAQASNPNEFVKPFLPLRRALYAMRTASSHVQMKALFFILLLAGHDAVRVTRKLNGPNPSGTSCMRIAARPC